ncbi:hypothetical protein D3C85_1392870 [compost metagenome]
MNSKPIVSKPVLSELTVATGSGNLIVRPEPSTTAPGAEFGSLSNISATPSPSLSFFKSSTDFSTLATRFFKASTS